MGGTAFLGHIWPLRRLYSWRPDTECCLSNISMAYGLYVPYNGQESFALSYRQDRVAILRFHRLQRQRQTRLTWLPEQHP